MFILSTDTFAESSVEWSESDIAAIKRLSLYNMGDSPELKSNRVAKDPKAVELGHHLFFNNQLSSNGEVSCASCHQPDKYFTDGLKTAVGIKTAKRNTPTVVGINQSHWLFFDGRTDSLWSQAMQPLEDSHEHGSTRNHVAHVVYNEPKLRQLYESLFGPMPDLSDKARFPEHAAPTKDASARNNWRKMSPEDQNSITTVLVNLAKSIAAYELELNPAASRFDDFSLSLSKERKEHANKLNSKEQAGLKLFLNKANCIICHNGSMFSDFGFHNIATPQVNPKQYDWGRYKGVNQLLRSEFNCYSEFNDDPMKRCDELKFIVRHREHTIGQFRTPSLRNISKTSPYMHSGQYKDLKEVIDHYESPPKTLLGSSDLIPFPIELSDQEKEQLEAFLLSLDSPINAEGKLLNPPVLDSE